MVVNIQINTKENFWEMNPDAHIIFSRGYKEDESEGKSDSSILMWAYTLMYHPSSILSEFTYSEKLEYIRDSYLYNDQGDPEQDEELNKLYKDMILTRKQRMLIHWEKQLDERERFQDSLTYQEDYEIKEKLMSNTKKLWDEFSRAEAEVKKEKEETSFGGAVESAAEMGKI